MQVDKEKIVEYWHRIRRQYLTRRNKHFAYLCKFSENLAELGLLLLFIMMLFIALLYGVKTFWFFFSATAVGQSFAQEFPHRADILRDIIYRNIVLLSATATLKAFAVCLTIAAIAQLLHIARFFYSARNIFYKILFWGLPLTVVVAFFVKKDTGLATQDTALVVSLIPTLCVFTGCFRFAENVIPLIYVKSAINEIERTPRKTKIVLTLSFITGMIAYLCLTLSIAPIWNNGEIFGRVDLFLYKNGVDEGWRFSLFYIWQHLPVWLTAAALGVALGTILMPPWTIPTLLCVAAYGMAPFLIHGYSPWGSESFLHWSANTLLHFAGALLILLCAWLSERKRYHWVAYKPHHFESEYAE